MKLDFDGKTVVVTGGTGALGSGVVDRLLAGDARVVIPVFNDAELDGMASKDHPGVTLVHGMDLTNAAAVDAMYGEIAALWASIHVAGGFAMGPIDGDDAAGQAEKMLAMNVRTCFNCVSAAVRAIRRRGDADGGRIVNVTARPGVCPREGKGMAAYAASKAAVAALTEAVAAEVAGDGIWVNAVAPSTIDTPANRKAMPDADHDAWPTPGEIAATIAFLASPANEATTGGVAPVYGRV